MRDTIPLWTLLLMTPAILLVCVCVASPGAVPDTLTPAWTAGVAGAWTDVAAADVNGDGSEDVLALERGGRLRVLSADGQRAGEHKLAPSVQLIQVANPEARSAAKIVGWGNWEESVFAYDLRFRPQWEYSYGTSGVDWVCLADVSGKGSGEVIIGYNGDGGLHLLDGRGKRQWIDKTRGNCWNVGSARDARLGRLVLSLDADGGIHAYDPTGTQRSTIGTGMYSSILGAADLDGDGSDEVVAIGSAPGRLAPEDVCVYGANGHPLWQRRLAGGMQSWRHKHLAFPMAGGGRRLVIAATDEGTVHVFDAKGRTWPVWRAGRPVVSLCAIKLRDGRQALVLATDRLLNIYHCPRPGGLRSPIPLQR